MNINYRKATLDDKKTLYDLGVLLNKYNLEHDLHENLFWEGWETDFDQEVTKELADPLISIYLAETDSKDAAGFILIKNCDNCGHFEVDQLFVKEEYRKQNVGRGLMEIVIAEAKKLDIPLQLEVYKSNSNALKFYEKLGFKEAGVVLRLEP